MIQHQKVLIVIALLQTVTALLHHFSRIRSITSVDQFNARSYHGLRSSSGDKETEFYDRSSVDSVLNQITETLAPLKLPPADGAGANITVLDVQQKFDKLLTSVRESALSPAGKDVVFTEAALMASDINDSVDGEVPAASTEMKTTAKAIHVDIPRTAAYSEQRSPLLIAYGPGPVAQQILSIVKALGKAANIKLVNAEFLSTMQDSELNFIVRDAKSVIIAADAVPIEKKGWFGSVEIEQPEPVLTAKGLKRLLNAVMNEGKKARAAEQQQRSMGSRSSSDAAQPRVKVVALGRACRQQRSAASFLAGDTTDLESEIILQCQQRNLDHNIIKVGQIIPDGAVLPSASSIRSRSVYKKAGATNEKLTDDETAVAESIFEPPFIYTTSKIIENSEVTQLSVAAEAVMRAVVHPHRNASVSVLSNPAYFMSKSATESATPDSNAPSAAEADLGGIDGMDGFWRDEMLKLDGPELLRFPLRFASARQIAVILRRVVAELQQPKSGLMTPIEVEHCSNGVRLFFRPLRSDYMSSKEEKLLLQQAETADQLNTAATANNPARKSGYISPEEQQRLENAVDAAAESTGTNDIKNKPSSSSGGGVASKKKQEQEGGVELIIERSPYVRVRARRCNMGPKTVPKLESEALILKAVERALVRLDADYRLLRTVKDKEKLWSTPRISIGKN